MIVTAAHNNDLMSGHSAHVRQLSKDGGNNVAVEKLKMRVGF